MSKKYAFEPQERSAKAWAETSYGTYSTHRAYVVPAEQWADVQRALRIRDAYPLRCQRCGAPHPVDCSIDSDVWNAIVDRRHGKDDDYGVLCLLCIDELAKEKGLTGDIEFYFVGDAMKSKLYVESRGDVQHQQARAEAAEKRVAELESQAAARTQEVSTYLSRIAELEYLEKSSGKDIEKLFSVQRAFDARNWRRGGDSLEESIEKIFQRGDGFLEELTKARERIAALEARPLEKRVAELEAIERHLDRRDALSDYKTTLDKVNALLGLAKTTDPKGELAKALAYIADLESRPLPEWVVGLVRDVSQMGLDCPKCGGAGWHTDIEPAHAPDCDGSCRNCPVPLEVQCPCQNPIHAALAAIPAEAREEMGI